MVKAQTRKSTYGWDQTLDFRVFPWTLNTAPFKSLQLWNLDFAFVAISGHQGRGRENLLVCNFLFRFRAQRWTSIVAFEDGLRVFDDDAKIVDHVFLGTRWWNILNKVNKDFGRKSQQTHSPVLIEDSSSLSFSPSFSLSHTQTHTLLHTISLSLSLLLTHKHSYTHSLTHPAYVSLSHTLYLTHTLTHVLFLSFDVRNGEASDSSTLNLIDYDVHHKAVSVL